jgi:thioredoxin-related protein
MYPPSRRRFISAAALALSSPLWAAWAHPVMAAGDAAEPRLNDDGLYVQPWFLESFLELRDDLDEAAASGKRLAVMWELRGCPYCKETHLVNFADPVISEFIQHHFEILQLNLVGSRIVTDFDGEELEERALARKYAINFTPTIQFFPPNTALLGEGRGRALEVARMPGYLRPAHFLAMFRFVQEGAYEKEDFRAYLKRNRSAAGKG